MLTLYKVGNASGRILPWTIWREGTCVYAEWTPPNCSKPQVSYATFDSIELADQGYRAAITKKRRMGYSETLKTPPMLPMLANDYNKRNAKYPYFVQPKFDGQRCIYNVEVKKMYSRTGQEIVSLPSLLELLIKSNLPSVDGELYCHEMSLQQILSITRETVNISDVPTMNYVLYDLPIPKMIQKERFNLFKELPHQITNPSPRIQLSPIYVSYDHERTLHLHEKLTAEGYEGVMLRDPEGTYQFGTRTSYLLKYKTELDDHFIINSIKKDKHQNPIFSLRSLNGLFNAVIEGTDSYRKSLYEKRAKLIGKSVHVRYFSLTDNGIPRNARIISFD